MVGADELSSGAGRPALDLLKGLNNFSAALLLQFLLGLLRVFDQKFRLFKCFFNGVSENIIPKPPADHS